MAETEGSQAQGFGRKDDSEARVSYSTEGVQRVAFDVCTTQNRQDILDVYNQKNSLDMEPVRYDAALMLPLNCEMNPDCHEPIPFSSNKTSEDLQPTDLTFLLHFL